MASQRYSRLSDSELLLTVKNVADIQIELLDTLSGDAMGLILFPPAQGRARELSWIARGLSEVCQGLASDLQQDGVSRDEVLSVLAELKRIRTDADRISAEVAYWDDQARQVIAEMDVVGDDAEVGM